MTIDALKILVVEDNITMQKVVTLFAKRKGISVVAVGSCQEAIQQIQSGASFALIFMDWSLPDRSGLECTACIRALQSDPRGTRVPIIAMTANLMAGDRERCLESGMDDFLGKPFGMSDFYQKLDKWLPVATEENILPFPATEKPEEEPRAGLR